MTKVKEIAAAIIAASQPAPAVDGADSSSSPATAASSVASLLASFQGELLAQATEHLQGKDLADHRVFANTVFFLQGVLSRYQSLAHRLEAATVPGFDAVQSMADFRAQLTTGLPASVTEAVTAEPGFMQRKAQAEKARLEALAKQRFTRQRQDRTKQRQHHQQALAAKKQARVEAASNVDIKVKSHTPG